MQAYRVRQSGGSMFWIVMAATLSLAGGAVMAQQLAAPAWVWGILLGSALLTAPLAWAFRCLELRVDTNGVKASWGGVFSKTIALEDIAGVEVGQYQWLGFGGWGWRYSFKGDVAFSILGVTPTLVVRRRNGRKLVVTMPEPQQAADAVNDWISA